MAVAADAQRVVVADGGGSIAWIDAQDRRIARAGVRVVGTPVDVALAGDTAWVADARGGHVVRVDLRTGAVGNRVRVGGRPVAVAAAGGDVYVLCAGDRSLVHVDGRRGEVRSRRTVGPGPAAIAIDRGSVWVAEATGRAVRRFYR